ncbi:hypothetical protein AUJ17_01505 [Candidatus Micrarchaeota archaeon CG1_02_47_40]|nr:MAG: hypothetical protein AUJ17_01505 [Candidatus Micrarchaeota archaeon CG1_02_47_40]
MVGEKERVEIDIKKFHESMEGLPIGEREKLAVLTAKKYCSDAEYFLKKGEIFTAFGSIAYAHGLLDAIVKYKD